MKSLWRPWLTEAPFAAAESAARAVDLPVGHKTVRVTVTADGGLELWLNGCLRKRREPTERDPLYVWTNVELYWEEHRYVEARYYRGADGGLEVTINGDTVYEAYPFTGDGT